MNEICFIYFENICIYRETIYSYLENECVSNYEEIFNIINFFQFELFDFYLNSFITSFKYYLIIKL